MTREPGRAPPRHGMDLTEAEDIKKRWQEHTEELYKKDFPDPDNHSGVITHLEPDILECEVKWALQPSPWVGPGKPNLPLGLRGKAGGCPRVTAGPKRPQLGVCPGASQAPVTSPTLPQPAPSRARTLEAGKRWAEGTDPSARRAGNSVTPSALHCGEEKENHGPGRRRKGERGNQRWGFKRP